MRGVRRPCIPAILLTLLVHGGVGAVLRAQTAVDTSKLGPQVGTTVPAFSGVDQFGRTQDLATLSGPKGLMLVFNRSADW